jgi:uncharacterized protein YjiS (DUF1127 family)
MSIQVHHPYSVAARLSLGTRTRSAITSLSEAYSTWRERAAQRRALARLDDRLLRDMGLSRSDVEEEVAKPFWHA